MMARPTMMVAVLLFLSGCGMAQSFGTPGALVDTYARMKLWESCVGGALARSWEERVDEATLECRRHTTKKEDGVAETGRVLSYTPHTPVATTLRARHRTGRLFVTTPPTPLPHTAGLLSTAGRPRQASLPLQAPQPPQPPQPLQPVWFTLFDQIPIFVQPSGGNSINFRQSRQKRSSDRAQFQVFLQNMVDGERSVRQRLANFTCILQNLGLVDARGDLLYDVMEQSTRAADLDPELRNDFLDVLDDCTRIARCESYRSHLVPSSLQRALAFLRCARDRRQVACIKRDLRDYLRVNLRNTTAGQTVDLEDMVNRIFYVTMAERGHEELQAVLLT